jgi:hypothetical protein
MSYCSSLFLSFPILTASSIVSGSFIPNVSGNSRVKSPAMIAIVVNIVIGRGFQIWASKGVWGATMDPILPKVEHAPIIE